MAMAAGPATADPFAAVIAAAGSGAGGRLAAFRQRAAADYLARGLPTRRDESWKYTDLKRLQGVAFRAAAAADMAQPVGSLPALLPVERHGARLVFVNGRLRTDLSAMGDLPPGVSIRPIAEAIGTDGDALLAAGALTALPMASLNAAMFADGVLIDVAAATEEAWLEVVSIGGGEAVAVALRHVVRVSAGGRLGLIEHHLTGGGFANSVMQIALADGAALRHYRLIGDGSDEAGNGTTVLTTTADVGAAGRYEAFALSLGSGFTRVETDVRLDGAAAACQIAGAYAIDGRAFCDNTTNVWHGRPRTTSRQVYRGAIDGEGHAVFQGRIVVEPGAQGTDGHQLSKALLLSDTAEIDQKPALEIFSDDVKCSHGAAAGQLDAQALFYLRSRGLPEATARQMLLEGFLADVLVEITDEAIRGALGERIVEAVHRLGKDPR
jgi:Fe-S cluster assembly protein SufD